MDDEFWHDEQRHNDRKKKQEQNIDKFAKDKICRTVETSIMTCCVGALSSFESAFGYLFGLGKNYNDLTEDEKDMKEKWMQARNEILKRGDTAIKISEKEIERCTITNYTQKRYNTIIKNKNYREQ